MFVKHLSVFLSLSAVATSHFVLQVPLSLGFNDTVEDVAPCDSFDPTDRSGGVTDWPVAGSSVVVLTTHLNVLWDFKAALLSDIKAGTPTWRPVTLQLSQKGVGSFCEPQIPGPPEWVGLDAVLQVVQHGPDGILYQCAAIRFQDLPFAGPDAACSNDTGVIASWIGEVATSTSSSVVLPTSSSSTPRGTTTSTTTTSTPGGTTSSSTTTTTSTSDGPTSSSNITPTGPTSSSTITSTGPRSSSTTTTNGPASSSSTPAGSKSSSLTTISQSTGTSVVLGPTTSAPGKESTTSEVSVVGTTKITASKESTTSGVSVAGPTKATTSKAATAIASGAPAQTPVQFTGASNTLFARVETVILGCSLAIFVALGL